MSVKLRVFLCLEFTILHPPISADFLQSIKDDTETTTTTTVTSQSRVTADGTYATQSALSTTTSNLDGTKPFFMS